MKHGAPILLQESRGGTRLTSKNSDGTFNITIIREGVGSTGIYSAELMSEASAAVFNNIGSHPGHPADLEHLDQRNPMGMIGRVLDVRPGEDGGRKALVGKFKPANAQVEQYVEEFQDILDFSIFCSAFGDKDDSGRTVVESFNGDFPYRSVDLVLAGGAGGRFQVAQESLLAIESSLGKPEGAQPGAAPAPGIHNQEDHMDPKDIAAIATAVAEAFKPVLTLLEEQKVAIEALKAGAPAPDAPKEAKDVIKGAVEALTAIDKAAIISETAKASLIAAVERGEDITESLAYVVKVQTESAAAAPQTFTAPSRYVAEAADASDKHDFTVGRLAAGVI